MNVFGIGLPEMALIFIVALLVFGPKKLPEIGRSLGKAIRSFQDASKEFESEFKREADALENSIKAPMKATLEPPERKAIASGDADSSLTADAPADSQTAEGEGTDSQAAEAIATDAADSSVEEQATPQA